MSRRKGQRKKAQQKKKNPSGGQQTPRRKRDGSAAIRGMLVGGGIVIALAFFFFVRIGGETSFNHLVGLFISEDSADESSQKPTENSSAGSQQAPSTQTIRPNGPMPRSGGSPIRIQPNPRSNAKGKATTPTTNFDRATPMETTTDEEQKGLEATLQDLAR